MEKPNYKLSTHAKERLLQRGIKEEWVRETIEKPDRVDKIDEDEVHFFKIIADFFSKCLKVVANPLTKIIITAHFDRSQTKKAKP